MFKAYPSNFYQKIISYLFFLLIFSINVAEALTLYAPWTDSETWQAGSPGSFYGQGYHTGNMHYAVDFNKRTASCAVVEDDGSPILSAHSGVITFAGWMDGYGYMVEIKSDQDISYRSLYAHFKYNPTIDPGIEVGQYVNNGTTIGKCGSTGYSTGPHLHFVLLKDGVSVRPSPLSGQTINDDEDGKCIVSNNMPNNLTTVYNFTTSTEGWMLGNSITNSRIESGKWALNTAIDPYVVGPTLTEGITSDQFKQVEIKMSVSGRERPYREHAYIYYNSGNGFNESEKLDLGEVLLNGQNKVYKASFPGGKQIKQVRMDPLVSTGLSFTPNDSIKIDFIRLVSSYFYWDFTADPKGWSLKNAGSEKFINGWVWQIQPTSGYPQAMSPWLGGIDTSNYKSLSLRFAVNRDTNSNGNPLTGKVYFVTKDNGTDETSGDYTYIFNVIPDSKQKTYSIPLPSTDKCTKIHRIRVAFYESANNEKYVVYLDKVQFSSQYVGDFPASQMFKSGNQPAGDAPPEVNITIQDFADMTMGTNNPIQLEASASGSCSNCYNWSLPQNPLALLIDSSGNISGNSGPNQGAFVTVIRAEDPDYPGTYAEQSFTITVTNDVNSSSIRIFNDGSGSLQVNNVYAQNGSAWIVVNSPYPFPFTAGSGQSKDVFISVNKQGLDGGNYSDNIVISSNDSNNSSVSVPITLNVTGDSNAPPAPIGVNVTPASWFSNGTVIVNWANPYDPSGISGAYYKTGAPPTTNTDGIYTSSKPFNITPANEGEQTVYLWLVDGVGNADSMNMNAVTIYYDSSAPIVFSKYPESGDTNIPVETSIYVNLTDQYSGVDQSSIVMTVNGENVSPTISGGLHGYSVNYTPAQVFNYGQTISVTINAKDLSSPQNVMPQVSWSFATAAGASVPMLNSFFINNDSASTSTSSVALNNSATGSPTHYMASESQDFSGAPWQAYSLAPSFMLNQGNGTKIVYLKVKNAIGESNVLNDAIILDEIAGRLEVTASSGSEIYTPPSANYQYRYGPSIILNGDTFDMWATAPGPGNPMDYIQHRRGIISISGTVQWLTDWTNAIVATPDSLDKCSTADPSVVYFNGYYYIGYTSTDQCAGGGISGNQVFVARCDGLPDGSVTCDKWNGSGWGGNPQNPHPIISYSGTGWGKGQPSFVVKGNLLYIYYTDDGTKVVTVDATNENWPSLINESQAITVFTNADATAVLGGKPGPFEVKYIDAYGKFIGLGVSSEFSTASNIFIYESADGLSFQPVAVSKSYWGSAPIQERAHNIGISGNNQGHLDINLTNFFAYGVGYHVSDPDPNNVYKARWPLYLNLISIAAPVLNTVALNPPTLTLPSNGASNQLAYVRLEWNDTNINPQEQGYEVRFKPAGGSYTSYYPNRDATYYDIGSVDTGTIYYWNARAIGDGINTRDSDWANSGTDWTFSTCTFPSTAPSMLSPGDGAPGVSLSPTFDWSDVPDATRYYLQICNDSGCSSIKQSVDVTNSQWTATPPLDPGTQYWWWIAAHNNCGGIGTGVWSFTTCNLPSAPNLIGPANGETGTFLNLDWADVSGATSYEVQVCSDAACNAVLQLQTGLINSQWTMAMALTNGVTYHWRVRAVNACGNGAWSGTYSFTFQVALPGSFSKTSPANGAPNQPTNPTLSWGSSSGAASYEYCYDSTNNNACDGNWTSTGSNTSVNLSGLINGTTYYWQVQARNAAGPMEAAGGWWSFTTACPAPSTPSSPSPGNGATGISTSPTLAWTASGADSYDVYFGTAANPPLVMMNSTNTNYHPTGLTGGATYYWKIVAKNNCGQSTAGPIWSFTVDTTGVTIPFTVLLNGSPFADLEWGWKPNATDNYDNGIDYSAPPPPYDGDDAYFLSITGQASPLDKLRNDFRGVADEAKTWKLVLKVADGKILKLQWDPQTLPAGWTFTLQEANASWVGTGSPVINLNSTPSEITLDNQTGELMTRRYLVRAFLGFPLTLKAGGWNLISLPVEPLDADPTVVFGPNLLSIYEWDASGRLYAVPSALQAKKGYWVAVGQDADLEVTGGPPSTSSMHLLTGWNLVGPVETGACPSGSPVLVVFGWGWPPNYQYVLPAQCEEGKGYWVAASQEGDVW
jgi:hypothetical protein